MITLQQGIYHHYLSYHQNSYELIDIDLSRQENTSVPQQINFAGKLEENDGAISFLLLKSSIKQF